MKTGTLSKQITYTEPIFKPVCKNGSLKYGGHINSIVFYGKLRCETHVYGKTKEEAEAKFYKIIGSDAVLNQQEEMK